MLFLKAQVSFPSNFASIFSATKHNSSVIFYPKHYILWSKAVYQSVNFWDFQGLESEFVKFFMSVLKRKVNSSSDFLAFFSVIRHNSSVSIQLMHFILSTKAPCQSPSFDTSKYSGKNLSNSSCHFPIEKSVFLQVLHGSSVS